MLEAGACGIYALANNCPGGIKEIIQPGINGEILAIENHALFAEEILQVLNGNHDKEAIRDFIALRFAKEIILKSYVELFKSM